MIHALPMTSLPHRRPLRNAVASLADWLRDAWRATLGRPAEIDGGPTPPAPLAGCGVLREGARLAEWTEARSGRRVA